MSDMKTRLRGVLKTIEPVTRAAERVAQIAVHARGSLTPIGMIGLASAATNALREYADSRNLPPAAVSHSLVVPVGHPHLAAACTAAGMEVAIDVRETSKNGEKGSVLEIIDGEYRSTVWLDGSLELLAGGPGYRDRLAAALDAYLPQAIAVTRAPSAVWYSEQIQLKQFSTQLGRDIAAATVPMLSDEGGRVILLNGKPGVGKSTTAQEVARVVGGRVLILGKGAFREREGHGRADSTEAPPSVETDWNMLRASVLIVDDIDKIYLSLYEIERLRRLFRLVILTANNGEHDEVIDGSLIRPERIDETWDVVPAVMPVAPAPFDRLPAEVWEKVAGWPIAYLKELEGRILKRGIGEEHLRIDDLLRRIDRKTRSGGHVYS